MFQKPKLLIFICFILCGLANSYSGFTQEVTAAKIEYVSLSNNPSFPGLVKIIIDTAGTLPTSKYIIRQYRYDTDTGYIAIDTIKRGDPIVYYHYNAKGHIKSESYDIVTYDSTNMQTAPSPCIPHGTIFLKEYLNDSCSQEQWTTWCKYTGESNLNYQIIINNNTPTIPDKDTLDINSVNFDKIYSYRVIGFKGSTFKTLSNTIELKTTDLTPPSSENFYVSEITNFGTSLKVTCNTDTLANISKYELWQVDNNILIDLSELLFSKITLDDNGKIANNFYKINAINTCNKVADSSEYFKPLILKTSVNKNIVYLTWNKSFDNSEEYNISLIIDNEINENFSSFDNQMQLDLNTNQYLNNESFLFQITETKNSKQKSISNTELITKNPKLIMHNAITPNNDGLNDDISPIIENAQLSDFEFYVYNKFGELIFKSTDYENAKWNGTYKNKKVQEGVYMYYVHFTSSLGKEGKESGVINVIYP